MVLSNQRDNPRQKTQDETERIASVIAQGRHPSTPKSMDNLPGFRTRIFDFEKEHEGLLNQDEIKMLEENIEAILAAHSGEKLFEENAALPAGQDEYGVENARILEKIRTIVGAIVAKKISEVMELNNEGDLVFKEKIASALKSRLPSDLNSELREKFLSKAANYAQKSIVNNVIPEVSKILFTILAENEKSGIFDPKEVLRAQTYLEKSLRRFLKSHLSGSDHVLDKALAFSSDEQKQAEDFVFQIESVIKKFHQVVMEYGLQDKIAEGQPSLASVLTTFQALRKTVQQDLESLDNAELGFKLKKHKETFQNLVGNLSVLQSHVQNKMSRGTDSRFKQAIEKLKAFVESIAQKIANVFREPASAAHHYSSTSCDTRWAKRAENEIENGKSRMGPPRSDDHQEESQSLHK